MDKPLRLMANRFCGCSVWALAPFFCCFWFLLFALFFRWRNASLAGGFAGRRVLLVFVVVRCFNRFACPNGHMSLYKCLFCLCSCKDRAFSATSATLEGKSPCCACMSLSRSPFGRLAFLSFFFGGGRERYRDNATSEELRLLTYRDHQSWVSHVGSSGNVACSLLLVRGPNPLEERAVKSAIGMSSLTSGFVIWLSDGCACYWL